MKLFTFVTRTSGAFPHTFMITSLDTLKEFHLTPEELINTFKKRDTYLSIFSF